MVVTDERIVLVVAGQGDLFSDKVILGLGAAGADVVRLDLSAAPLSVDCEMRDGAWHGVIQASEGRPVQLERVGAVLWRWSGPLPGHPGVVDDDRRAWAALEDTEAVLGVLRCLPAYWMSHPDRLAAVEGAKPVQLRDAAQAGLMVPATLIATHGAPAARWMDPGVPHIYKAFRAPYKPCTGPAGWVLATRVQGDLPEELCAASMFQQMIGGTPIRVTVIGEQMFAVAVTGVAFDVDWRPQQTEAVLKPVDVSDPVRAAIGTLMAQWGLSYGTLDFIAADTGEWVFLEVNPTGAYGFVEEGSGLPLTQVIAETLIRGGRYQRAV